MFGLKQDSIHQPNMITQLVVIFLILTCSGLSLFGQGKLEESDDPEDPIDPRFRQAQEAHLAGELVKALAIYDKILSTRGDDVPTFITYGNILWKLGRLDEAVKMLKKAESESQTHQGSSVLRPTLLLSWTTSFGTRAVRRHAQTQVHA